MILVQKIIRNYDFVAIAERKVSCHIILRDITDHRYEYEDMIIPARDSIT